MQTINRREAFGSMMLLTACPAGLAVAGAEFSVPAKSACVHDPIFQLIEEHRAARKAFHAALGNEPAANNPAALHQWELNEQMAGEREYAATIALLSTPPTTLAGAVALLQYVEEHSGDRYLTADCLDAGNGYDALVSSLIETLAPMVRP